MKGVILTRVNTSFTPFELTPEAEMGAGVCSAAIEIPVSFAGDIVDLPPRVWEIQPEKGVASGPFAGDPSVGANLMTLSAGATLRAVPMIDVWGWEIDELRVEVVTTGGRRVFVFWDVPGSFPAPTGPRGRFGVSGFDFESSQWVPLDFSEEFIANVPRELVHPITREIGLGITEHGEDGQHVPFSFKVMARVRPKEAS